VELKVKLFYAILKVPKSFEVNTRNLPYSLLGLDIRNRPWHEL